MRPFISTTLILVMLLGQAIAAAPHWHAEVVDVEPAAHAARAHVHLHSDHDHAHHHEPEAPAEPASDQHDDDAVYVTDLDLTNVSNSISLPELAASFAVLPSIHTHAVPVLGDVLGWLRDHFGDGVPPQCALYAQILSIRC